MLLLTLHQRWSDVWPAAQAFDAEQAHSVVSQAVARATQEKGRVRQADVARAIDVALVDACGGWIAGWNWAASEPGGGGPIGAWCCADHSVRLGTRKNLDATCKAASQAAEEWHAFLAELARHFDTLRSTTADLSLERGAEHAAAYLLPIVLERTDAEDAWYTTFAQILCWYLESAGYASAQIETAVESVVSGRFRSWIAPDEAAAQATCRELGATVADAAAAATPGLDGVAAWRRCRTAAFDQRRHNPSSTRLSPVAHDAHRGFIARHDQPRDPTRAERLSQALSVCRSAAAGNEPLRFEQLAEWQGIVLGEATPAFRRSTAYAKGGRDQYGWDPSLERKFRRHLAEVNDPEVPLAVRAARVYLDICFYHPFSDGNARAARLALDHTLTRAGQALASYEPVVTLARSPSDAIGALHFVLALEYLVGQKRF